MPFTVLVTAPRLAPAGLALLDAAGCQVLYLPANASDADVQAALTRNAVDAVISRTATLSGQALRACASLQVVCKHGVGVSNIDVAAATALGVPVFTTPGANAASVAELTIGLMLAAARRIATLDASTRAGQWARAQDGQQLGGNRLGLVGYGQVGRKVAAVAQALGMRVHAFDPALPDSADPGGVRRMASLDALLPLSDVLSLHIPLNARTRGLIGVRELALLPPGAILVNTARGEVVDEPALVAALASGHLFAAGLDTMADEPLPAGSALGALPNVVLTPHVGGSTAAALDAMAEGAARCVLAWLRVEAVDRTACVNPETLVTPVHA